MTEAVILRGDRSPRLPPFPQGAKPTGVFAWWFAPDHFDAPFKVRNNRWLIHHHTKNPFCSPRKRGDGDSVPVLLPPVEPTLHPFVDARQSLAFFFFCGRAASVWLNKSLAFPRCADSFALAKRWRVPGRGRRYYIGLSRFFSPLLLDRRCPPPVAIWPAGVFPVALPCERSSICVVVPPPKSTQLAEFAVVPTSRRLDTSSPPRCPPVAAGQDRSHVILGFFFPP